MLLFLWGTMWLIVPWMLASHGSLLRRISGSPLPMASSQKYLSGLTNYRQFYILNCLNIDCLDIAIQREAFESQTIRPIDLSQVCSSRVNRWFLNFLSLWCKTVMKNRLRGLNNQIKRRGSSANMWNISLDVTIRSDLLFTWIMLLWWVNMKSRKS